MTATSWDPDTIDELVSRLTLDQKIAQLTGFAVPDLVSRATGERPTSPVLDVGRLPTLRPHGVGHLSLAWFLGPDGPSLRNAVAEVQAAVRDVSPFGIGALVHNEAINGFLHRLGRSSTPRGRRPRPGSPPW